MEVERSADTEHDLTTQLPPNRIDPSFLLRRAQAHPDYIRRRFVDSIGHAL
jgi:hypothetical protein